MKFTLSKNSAIKIYRYESMDELAKMLVPALQAGSVGLSGGTTYKSFCSAVGKLKPNLQNSWFLAVDERAVPFEDPQSNWGSCAAPMLEACGIPEQAYNHYDNEGMLRMHLRNRFDTEPYIFDSIFLGIGEDGHTASLFPGSPAVDDMDNSFMTVESKVGVKKRITLGPKVIVSAKRVVAVMAGASKEGCLNAMLHHDMSVPFISILSRRKETELYLDAHLYDYLKETISSWL